MQAKLTSQTEHQKRNKHFRFSTESPSSQRRSRRFASSPKTALSFEIGVRRTEAQLVRGTLTQTLYTHSTQQKIARCFIQGNVCVGRFSRTPPRVLSAQWLLPSCAFIRAASPKSPEETLGEPQTRKRNETAARAVRRDDDRRGKESRSCVPK